MVQTVYRENRNGIIDLFRDNSDLSLADVRFCLDKSDDVVIYTDDSQKICGCGTFRLWGEQRNKADAYIYVIPQMRGSGVGKMLFHTLTDISRRNTLAFISTKIETNHSQSLAFFRKAGFEIWYTGLTLCHSGERQPASGLRLINYRSEYFVQYIDAIRNSFYELRRANDFQPYYCCEPDEEKKKELERKKNDIYLLMDGSEIAASVIIDADSIDDVFVTPGYQGKGIGKKLMQFAVNRAIDRGNMSVTLSAIEWNTRALHLYESVGFHITKTVTYLRLFL